MLNDEVRQVSNDLLVATNKQIITEVISSENSHFHQGLCFISGCV